MTRFQTWIACAVAGSLAASLLALARARGGTEEPGTLERRLAALEAERPVASPPAASDGAEHLERRLAELADRIGRLESSARRRPVEAQAAPAPPVAREAAAAADGGSPAIDAAARGELESLLALFGPDFDFDGTPEEMQRFYELAREAGVLDDAIAELEARVAGNAGDLEARMELADLYVAKLMTLPHGPEQGIWGGKAEDQWRAVVERDPEHWKASFSLGHNFAFYPDVMGKTEEAIRFLEQARRIQERSAPGDDERRVYLALSRLHLRRGDRDQARAVLEAGLARHPSNAEILRALEELDG